MDNELKKEIETLKQELNQYKQKVDDLYSEASFPDQIQRNLVRRGFMKVSQALNSFGTTGATFDNFFVDYLNRTTVISGVPSSQYVNFTVASLAGNTLNAPIGSDMNDEQVVVLSSDALPDPLSAASIYYIINASGTTIQLAGSLGGSAINITNIGSGRHYLRFI